MLTEIVSRRAYRLLLMVALLGVGVISVHAQAANSTIPLPPKNPSGRETGDQTRPTGTPGIPGVGIRISITPRSGGSLISQEYYNLVSRLARCLKMPERTPDECALKVQNLTATFTLKDRLKSTTGVSKSARFFWNTETGLEATGGYPVQKGGTSAGTMPKHGYRPHLLDLYANWKAASLADDAAAKKHFYTEVLAAFPLVNAGARPYIYKSPVIYALVADAALHLDERVEQTFLLWQQFDADAIKNAHLRATDPNLEKKKNAWLLQQLKMDLKVDPPTMECNSTVTDAIARAICDDAQRVKAQLAQAVQESIVFADLAFDQHDLAQAPIITGTYVGLPAEGKPAQLPLTLWVENDAGEVIGDRHDVQPGEGFTLVLNNIGEQNGVARIHWSLREEKLAAFLQLPVNNRAPGDGFPYAGAIQAEERFLVRFRAKGGQPDAWAAVSGTKDARNRETIGIRYDWNSSTMKTAFAWRIYRVEEGKRQEPSVLQQTENAPKGELTIPAGTLARGNYVLTVQQDTRKTDPADFAECFAFRVTSPAVALVIGVTDYYSSALNHPCDDAVSIVARLKAASYADEDIIWIYGQHDRNNKQGVLIAHGLGKSLANLDSIQGKAIEPLAEQPDTVVIDNAYVTPDVMSLARLAFANLIADRKPIHALFFYAGHGSSKQEKGSIADVLVSARPPGVPIWDEDLYLNQFTEIKALLAPQAQQTTQVPPVFVSIVDACRPSVAGVDASGLASRLEAGMQDNVLLLPLYSAALGEISFETGARGDEILYQDQPVPHGLFTFALLQGFDKAAGNYAVKIVLPLTIDVMNDLVSKVNDFTAPTRGPNIPGSTQTITVGKKKLKDRLAMDDLENLILQIPLIY